MSHTQAAIQSIAAAFAANGPEHRALYQEAIEAVVQLACAELMAALQLDVVVADDVRH